MAVQFELPEPNIKYIMNCSCLWCFGLNPRVMLQNFEETFTECICILLCSIPPHQWNLNDVRKHHQSLDHQNRFLITIRVINISPQSFKTTSQTTELDQEPTQVFIQFWLILFSLSGFLFFDLSIQNRPFLSSLSVHFASIDIRVVSTFWVVSSSGL